MRNNNGEISKDPINLQLDYQMPKTSKNTIIYYQPKYIYFLLFKSLSRYHFRYFQKYN